ncbi:MAG: hypothetical protein ACO1OQ_02730 [Rufibacter sp.]
MRKYEFSARKEGTGKDMPSVFGLLSSKQAGKVICSEGRTPLADLMPLQRVVGNSKELALRLTVFISVFRLFLGKQPENGN